MLTGIKLRANPTSHQKLILSQWMGCARSIWNAKVEEERYYRTYARKYCTIGTYAPIDQTTSQFKSKELSPWLSECPSQILRNSAVNWYQTYQKFMSGKCGRPKRKPKTDKEAFILPVKCSVSTIAMTATCACLLGQRPTISVICPLRHMANLRSQTRFM
ncbi:helix-turn-helix domain-containing protein [Chlamydia suis]|uniref:helix-turn-helix domain-containing protein n=1 Tax=Chlamydia suis TaxID=83559 RepID=UPI002B39B285|nr:helix-turn-helix domain-containing protein [Chlamydia suis]MEB2694251.1 helix-turn-helix domain-containing protein [Chlamydia suis]